MNAHTQQTAGQTQQKREIVKDGRTLRGMASQALIIWPVDKGHKYVRRSSALSRRFVYHGKSYQIEYVDGCFYPFVMAI